MSLLPFYQEELLEAGCDEAGRGCYAGPVFAAAVILPKEFHHPLLNDSKQVNEANRTTLRLIIEEQAIAYAVAKVEVEEIDQINILKASFKAMHLAIDKLKQKPQLLLIDGNRFIKYKRTAHKTFVKGDGRFASIAAASILAKTYRDGFMLAQHDLFPHFNWKKNKGYPTKEHREAIAKYGPCKYHRMSFRLLPEQLILDL